MTIPDKVVERAARAYDPMGWSWYVSVEDEHPAKAPFFSNATARMRAALEASGLFEAGRIAGKVEAFYEAVDVFEHFDDVYTEIESRIAELQRKPS